MLIYEIQRDGLVSNSAYTGLTKIKWMIKIIEFAKLINKTTLENLIRKA